MKVKARMGSSNKAAQAGCVCVFVVMLCVVRTVVVCSGPFTHGGRKLNFEVISERHEKLAYYGGQVRWKLDINGVVHRRIRPRP